MEGSKNHQDVWRRRVQDYEETYFTTLRQMADRYASIPEAFPEDFHNPVKSLAVYCSDGLILVRFLADADRFEFEVATGETIFEAARRLRAGDLSFKVPRARRWFTEFRNFRVEFRFGDDDEPTVITPDWFSFSASRGFPVAMWSPDMARHRARSEALTYVAAHLLSIDVAEFEGPKADVVKKTYGVYEAIINEFERLIESSDLEAPLQEYLTNHPELLTLEAARVFPKFKLGDDYITDFVLELGHHEYVLVEIEAANRQLYTKAGDPASPLNHAIQQVEDWRMWIESASQYIQTKLPGVVEPECWVVIGRRLKDKQHETKWRRKKRNLSSAGIHLFTYDDLLDRARRQLASLRGVEGD